MPNIGLRKILGEGKELVFGLAVMVAFLLPHTSLAFQLVNPILCTLLFLLSIKNYRLFIPVFIPIFAIAVSAVLNIGLITGAKSVLTVLTIVLYLLSFPLLRGVRLPNFYLYITFCIIFLTQVGYMLDLGVVTSFVDKYYPISWNEEGIENMINSVSVDNYRSFRLGGLYRNPNHCAKYITLLFAAFLVLNKDKKTVYILFISAIVLFAISLTGSRTGFVVTGLLILLAIKNYSGTSKIQNWVLAIVLIVGLALMIRSGDIGRGTRISEGMSDSFGLKLQMTLDYLRNEHSLSKYLFGNLDASMFQTDTAYSFDCEYGYLIYCYGFVGFFAFVYLFYRLYKFIPRSNRLFFLVCLWMLTSSILMSYRTVFVFFLLLPLAINQEKNV